MLTCAFHMSNCSPTAPDRATGDDDEDSGDHHGAAAARALRTGFHDHFHDFLR
jgi:hypothetical protein